MSTVYDFSIPYNSALKKMTGGLVLAAVAFVICAFVQIQIQVCSLNSPLFLYG